MQETGFPDVQFPVEFANTEATFIDGAPMNNGYINAISYAPSQDSIQEFRIEGNNIGPEFGGTTDGIVTMVTKSGTNAFHGTAFDFLRNTDLNASTFFAIGPTWRGRYLYKTSTGQLLAAQSRKTRSSSLVAFKGFVQQSDPPRRTQCRPPLRKRAIYPAQRPSSIRDNLTIVGFLCLARRAQPFLAT